MNQTEIRVREIIEDDDVENLEEAIELVRYLQDVYNNSDEEVISDELYDELYDFIHRNNIEVVGASVSTGGRKPLFHHNYPDLRGTLDKVHYIRKSEKKDKRKSIEEFVEGIERVIGRKITRNDECKAFIKYDGVSVIEEVNNGVNEIALKRGNVSSNEAEEIECLRGVRNQINLQGRYGVKNEFIMPIDYYEKFCEVYGKFKSPRAAVSSVLNSDDTAEKMKYIVSVPLQIQMRDTGELIYEHGQYGGINGQYCTVDMTNMDSVEKAITYLRQYARDTKYPCDGIVFVFTDPDIKRKMGRNSGISKWEVAYKFPPTLATSEVTDVVFSMGLMGYMTPVVKIKPVKMDGNTISSISIGSLDIFNSYNLAIGDTISLKYNIIPTMTGVVKRSGNKPIAVQYTCPSCGHELEGSPKKCVNEKCDIRVIGKIYNYANKIGIKYFSERVATILYKNGVIKNIEDIYHLPKSLPKEYDIGEKTYSKILKSIDARKELSAETLLGSLGIDGAGRRIFSKILDVMDTKMVLQNAMKGKTKPFEEVEGVGKSTAEVIVDGILNNITTISKLAKIIKIKKQEKVTYDTYAMISKVRDKEFENYLNQKGIGLTDKFDKDAVCIIVPSLDVSSSKIEKAKERGIKVVTLEQAKEDFGFNNI